MKHARMQSEHINEQHQGQQYAREAQLMLMAYADRMAHTAGQLQCTYRLVGKTDTKTQKDTSNVQHSQVSCTSVDGSTDSEPETGNHHAPLATQASIQEVRGQTSNGTCM